MTNHDSVRAREHFSIKGACSPHNTRVGDNHKAAGELGVHWSCYRQNGVGHLTKLIVIIVSGKEFISDYGVGRDVLSNGSIVLCPRERGDDIIHVLYGKQEG